MPQILTQIVKCPVPVLQVMVQEVVQEADRAAVYEDDHEEKTLQADAEPVEKEGTGFIQDTDAPLYDESVIAVRDEFLDVSDEKVPAGQAQFDDTRSMTIKANNKIVRDTSCAFDVKDQGLRQRSVLLTPETKDSINGESLMRFSVRDQTSVTSPMRHPGMPKRATLISATRPEKGARGRDA